MKFQQKIHNIRTGWAGAILIALAVMGAYLFIGTRSTLWDRDEPRFARATVEMVESGNYLVPTFNGRLRPDKPILIYWLMSLPVRLLGPTEFACRFFAAVGTSVTCLLTFVIGKGLLGPKAGLWAMAILASTLMMLCIGTAATADAVLLPCMVAALAVFVHAVGSGAYAAYTVLMGIAIGLGLLAKGPVALLPIAVIAASSWLSRGANLGRGWRLWQVVAACLVGVLIFLAWAIPANNATHGEFLRLGIGQHVLNRAARPLELHGGHFLVYLPYYLLVIAAAFFPWTLHLPGAISALLAGRVGGQYYRAFLAGWAVSVFIIMTLVSTKLPHYVLFMWPAMALAVAGTLTAAEQNVLAARDLNWLRRGVWLFAPLAIAVALGFMMVPWFLEAPGLRWAGSASGAVLLAMTAIAVRQQWAGRPGASARTLLVGMCALQVPILFGVLPAIEQVKVSPAIGKTVREKTSGEVTVATYRFGEPTLNFYIGRRIEPLRDEEAVVTWARQSQPGVLIIPTDTLAAVERRHGFLALDRVASKKGINYSKGTSIEVAALIRKAKTP